MTWRHITTLIFLLIVASPCLGSNPMAKFHMEGVTGTATFSLSGNVLTVNLDMDTALGSTRVELRPLWMNYDVEDKCGASQLGSVESGRTGTVTIQRDVRVSLTFANVESLNDIEGHSIVLVPSSPAKTICAGIWQEGDHFTAVARFRGSVLGSVYLRQHNSTGSIARVVTDLFTQANYRSGTWRISDTYADCDAYMAGQNAEIYDPTSSDLAGCDLDEQFSCAVGDMSGKHGNVEFGTNHGEVKRAYTDQNLYLSGEHGVAGKLLIIYPTGNSGPAMCSHISLLHPRQARVEFGHSGVTGFIEFSQNSPLDPTEVTVDLENLRSIAGGYHVHKWPTPTRVEANQNLCDNIAVSGHFNPYNKEPSSASYPRPDASTDDMYEIGDLSAKYGMLNSRATISSSYTDWNLPLFGAHSIIGRSLVIHRNDASASRWICSNIEPVHPVITAVAKFKYPVIGQVTFMQAQDDPDSDTAIFAELDNSDGLTGTQFHQWGIYANAPTSDMLNENSSTRCVSTGDIYNPESLWIGGSNRQYSDYCTANKMSACKMGDLGNRLGTLSIRNSASTSSDKRSKVLFTDTSLPLSGPHSIIGRSVVIMSEAGDQMMACAGIQRQHPAQLVARLLGGGINGVVTLTQKTGMGAKWTMVTGQLTGLASNHRLRIHELPPLPDDDTCSDLGEVFNPLDLGAVNSPMTDDEFKVGDLDHHGASSEWHSSNLPLTGVTSVQGRSLVVVDTLAQNAVRACGKLQVALPQDSVSHYISATVSVSGDFRGSVHLMQAIFSDDTMSDTSIVIDVSHAGGEQSLNHNWHTHINPISGDAQATSGRCSSAGPHFDPYMAMKSNEDVYPQECSLSNPLRCEVGDQSNKLGTYDIGGGRKAFTDIDLPLAGMYTVLGRSIVFHVKDRGAPRLTCADIIPTSGETTEVVFTTPQNMDKRQIAAVYANAIRANVRDVVVEIVSHDTGTTTARVHFVGMQASEMKKRFDTFIGEEERRQTLGPYSPIVNGAGVQMISGFLLLVIASLHLLHRL